MVERKVTLGLRFRRRAALGGERVALNLWFRRRSMAHFARGAAHAVESPNYIPAEPYKKRSFHVERTDRGRKNEICKTEWASWVSMQQGLHGGSGLRQ